MQLFIGNKVYSSWSMRPWVLLKAKGIAFDEQLIQLRAEDTPHRIRRVSPSSKVPCLVDGDVIVWESLAIMEYLADKFAGKNIWPQDVKARAHARAIASEMHAGFQALRGHCPMTITQRFAARALPDDVEANVKRIQEVWAEARAKFGSKASGPFLYGDYSAADAMYAPVVSRFYTYSIMLDATCQAYVDAMRGHPSYQAWLADAAKEPWKLVQNEGATILEDLRA